MRTTLTLDDDVAEKLREKSRLLGKPFKQVVNDALRRGLTSPGEVRKTKKFKVKPNKGGLAPGVDSLRLNQLNDELEADDFISKIS